MFSPRLDRDSLPADPTDLPEAAGLRAPDVEEDDETTGVVPALDDLPEGADDIAANVAQDDPAEVVDDEPIVISEGDTGPQDLAALDDDAPSDTEEARRSLAEEVAAEARAKLDAADASVSTPGAGRRSSLADRAPRPAMSALEALEAAKRAEASEPPAPKKQKRASKARAPAPPRDDTPVEIPEEEAGIVVAGTKDPAPTTRRVDPRPALAELGDVRTLRLFDIEDRKTFRAVWNAHRAHALNAGDLGMVAMASVLVDASRRVEPGHLHAAEIELDGVRYAVWVDTGRDVLLGIAHLPNVWLAGL